MTLISAGLHHVTAIAGAPQPNLDFYTRILGLRLVKTTVNFDAPDVYHFYFGDRAARPGTILTFFPFTDAARGRVGTGMADTVAFAIPRGSLDSWVERLSAHGVPFDGPIERFGSPALRLADPDGMAIELAEGAEADPADPAIRGFDGVTLRVEAPERTARLLTEGFGFVAAGQAEDRQRFAAPGGGIAAHVDLLCSPGSLGGVQGAGTIHHIAFRARDDAEHAAWRRRFLDLGFNVTPILDRQYFRAIYFREPGGVLFEVATDPPGFATDETPETMGTALKLPPWLEKHRAAIERRLPPVTLPRPPA